MFINKMHFLNELIVLVVVLQVCYAPPVTKDKKEEQPETQTDGLEDYIEYHRYIREVVNALESDATFRDKLEKANEDDIRSGKIAHDLEFVSHQVRTRLDEIKRTELDRLRTLMTKKNQLMEDNHMDDGSPNVHIDHSNPHTFEIEDLKRLIQKTTEDLAEADRKRRDEFKEYEMQKEYEWQQKLNETTAEEERKKLEEEHQKMLNKHKKHEKLHTPGHKQQLEEVWQEQDHMQQDFNPKTFFALHDLDSNGLWDQDEVKALFIKELDKMYAAGAPEDDMRERVEEMERMRESVFTEMDYNRDGFIDYKEFLHQTQKQDFEKDQGWRGLDEQKPYYTDEELQEYIRQHQMQYPQHGYHPNDVNNQMYNQQPYYPQPSGYHPPAHGEHPPQGYMQHPQQAQMHYPQQQQQQQHGNYPQAQMQHPQGQVPHPQAQRQHGQVPHPQAQMQHPQGQMPHAQAQMQRPQGQMQHPQAQMQHSQEQIPHPQAQMKHSQEQIPHPQAQFQPGQLPQVQVNPQQMQAQEAKQPPHNAPSLNTNEVYSNDQQHKSKENLSQAPQQQQPHVNQHSNEKKQDHANVKMV